MTLHTVSFTTVHLHHRFPDSLHYSYLPPPTAFAFPTTHTHHAIPSPPCLITTTFTYHLHTTHTTHFWDHYTHLYLHTFLPSAHLHTAHTVPAPLPLHTHHHCIICHTTYHLPAAHHSTGSPAILSVHMEHYTTFQDFPTDSSVLLPATFLYCYPPSQILPIPPLLHSLLTPTTYLGFPHAVLPFFVTTCPIPSLLHVWFHADLPLHMLFSL